LKNLFVGNQSSNRAPDELRTLFQTYGAVEEVQIITDPNTGYSRGFAFVEMTSDIAAMKAVVNGTTVWGNPLKVEVGKPGSNLKRNRVTAMQMMRAAATPNNLPGMEKAGM
jgi:cold-inducible RNA-binding protein